MNYNNYTDQELAEAYIFPSELSAEEKKVADAELKKLRFEQLYQMTDAQKRAADLWLLKLQDKNKGSLSYNLIPLNFE